MQIIKKITHKNQCFSITLFQLSLRQYNFQPTLYFSQKRASFLGVSLKILGVLQSFLHTIVLFLHVLVEIPHVLSKILHVFVKILHVLSRILHVLLKILRVFRWINTLRWVFFFALWCCSSTTHFQQKQSNIYHRFLTSEAKVP